MYKIHWGHITQRDFRRLRDFLKDKNITAANKVRPTIKKSVETLRDNPELGTSLDDAIGRRVWRIPFGDGDYIIYYVPDHQNKIISILKIWHSREDRN